MFYLVSLGVHPGTACHNQDVFNVQTNAVSNCSIHLDDHITGLSIKVVKVCLENVRSVFEILVYFMWYRIAMNL